MTKAERKAWEEALKGANSRTRKIVLGALRDDKRKGGRRWD